MAGIPDGFRVYSEVVIDLRNLQPVSGRVAWCKRDRVGIAFDEKIDLDVFFGRRVSQQATGFLHKLNAGRSEINAEPFIRTLNSYATRDDGHISYPIGLPSAGRWGRLWPSSPSPSRSEEHTYELQ